MQVEFKQYFWVAKAVGLGVVLAFAGSALVQGLGFGLILDADAADAQVELGPRDDANAFEDDYPMGQVSKASETSYSVASADKAPVAEGIVEKNIFCPTCRTAPELVLEGPTGQPTLGMRKSTLPLALVATMEAEEPGLSRATIADAQTGTLGLYLIEDEVRPGLTLRTVDRGRAVLESGRGLEYLTLGEEAPAVAATSLQVKGPTAQKPSKTQKWSIEGADDAISCSSDTSCTVDKAFFDKMFNMPDEMKDQARVVPSMRDGETQGFKFYGVRTGSVPRLLGMRNGDLITNVNGTDLTSLDDVMGLYTKLRKASDLSITFERGGETIQKEIEIK